MSGPDERLGAVTRMVFDAELSQLKVRTEDLAARRASLTALVATRQARATVLAGAAGDDLALATGQDARWQNWLRVQERQVLVAIARAAARQEEQRLKARRAFGRMEALRSVQARVRAERNAAQARRQRDEGFGG